MTAETDIERARELLAEPLFLIIAGGDGNDQKLALGYEPAARAAFKLLIHGEPEDEDNNDYDVAIYNAIKNPDSEEWNDAGAQGIVFSFEDGFLQVVRVAAAPDLVRSLLQRVEKLEAENKELREALERWDSIDLTPATQAVQDVLGERERQQEDEGWTPEHDDEHNSEEMADAAALYALSFGARLELQDAFARRDGSKEYVKRPALWPWSSEWWKPKDRRSDLVRAGALIIAEIERLDRARTLTERGE